MSATALGPNALAVADGMASRSGQCATSHFAKAAVPLELATSFSAAGVSFRSAMRTFAPA